MYYKPTSKSCYRQGYLFKSAKRKQCKTNIYFIFSEKQSDSSVCKVTVDASESLGYTDDTWIVVAVTFRDYTRRRILFGNNPMIAGSYSLSVSNAQVNITFKN